LAAENGMNGSISRQHVSGRDEQEIETEERDGELEQKASGRAREAEQAGPNERGEAGAGLLQLGADVVTADV
jgi:hypothetical protein